MFPGQGSPIKGVDDKLFALFPALTATPSEFSVTQLRICASMIQIGDSTILAIYSPGYVDR